MARTKQTATRTRAAIDELYNLAGRLKAGNLGASLAHAFASNATQVVLIDGEQSTITTAAWTPTATGKLRVTAVVNVQNPGDGNTSFQLAIGFNGGANAIVTPTAIYEPAEETVQATLIWEWGTGQAGFPAFAVGTEQLVNMNVIAGGAGGQVNAQGAQLVAQELS